MFKFELPREQSSMIKVIGVGGGGSNAVNYMFRQQIKGVDFIVCNTDSQALETSPVPTRIQLGESLTEGLGAGAIPEVGRNAAIENIEDIKTILGNNTKMVFITAGMGGGTGTGAAPVIAQTAKDMGILTVGIVTIPFNFEGKKRRLQAEEGLENMRKAVDTLLVINNDKLREMFGNLTLANAFAQADEVLNTAARGIAEMISVTGLINVDFNDVNTVMRDSGVAIMGSATAEGENRARVAVEKALSSPLLNENYIQGAKYVLLNITYGMQEVTMDEIAEITDYIQEEAGSTADVIWGHGFDADLGDKVAVTVIATGFHSTPDTGVPAKMPEKKVHNLNDERPTMITQPIASPTQAQVVVTVTPPVAEEPKEEEPYLKPVVQETETPQMETPVQETVVQPQATVIDEPELKTITPVSGETPVAQKEAIQEAQPVAEKPEVIRHWLVEDEPASPAPAQEPKAAKPEVKEAQSALNFGDISAEAGDKHLSAEEQQQRAHERMNRIRELSSRLKTPAGLNDLENEPAYMRRNVTLTQTPHSSESSVSKLSISDDTDEQGNKTTGLRSNNSFLHDNVD